MSDPSPAPGWWMASDGNWYAPELHPQRRQSVLEYPPPLPPYPSAAFAGAFDSPTRSTNGLAVASLVLGIVWIFWIGSILALIFGYVALKQIKARHQAGRGLALAGVVLGWVGLALGIGSLVIGLTVGVAFNGFSRVPNPEQPVAGSHLALPHALFLANSPGSSVMVTPTQADAVTRSFWTLWETAQIQRNTTALTQLVSRGPILASELSQCDWPTGACVEEKQPRPIISLQSVVPVQVAYPLHFLTQIRTDEYVADGSGPYKWRPWVELLVLTKASPTAPWQLSFDTGFDGVSVDVAEVPFDETASVQGSPPIFNPAPSMPGPVPTSQFLPLLASYWQSWKDTGAAPPDTVFAQDGDTSGFGQQLSQSPQGVVEGGIETQYHYAWYPSGGTWVFSSDGGRPLVCGTVSVDVVSTPVDSGPLNQNFDRTNWGMALVPGAYAKIVTVATHQSCVYVVANDQLDAAGGPTANALTVTGVPMG